MTDEINLSLQGRNIYIFLLKPCLFQTSNKFLAESKLSWRKCFSVTAVYSFELCTLYYRWHIVVRNPFSVLEMHDMSAQDYKAFRDITIDFTLKKHSVNHQWPNFGAVSFNSVSLCNCQTSTSHN
jgi:hypothetical protein